MNLKYIGVSGTIGKISIDTWSSLLERVGDIFFSSTSYFSILERLNATKLDDGMEQKE